MSEHQSQLDLLMVAPGLCFGDTGVAGIMCWTRRIGMHVINQAVDSIRRSSEFEEMLCVISAGLFFVTRFQIPMAKFRHQLVAPGRRMKPGCWKMHTISSFVRYRVHVRSQGIKLALQLLALFMCRKALEYLQTHMYQNKLD